MAKSDFSFEVDWFEKFERYIRDMYQLERKIKPLFEKYGELGRIALSEATPRRTGLTASSWIYSIELDSTHGVIKYENTNTNKGQNIAILIQYGHGTGTGGYVAGIDYINPALTPIFNDLANELWKEVTSV